MKVSLNTVKQYTDVDLTVDELVAKINAQLGGVENVTDFGDRYKDARIVRVVACEKHPNADKLNVCKVDDGGSVVHAATCGNHTDDRPPLPRLQAVLYQCANTVV